MEAQPSAPASAAHTDSKERFSSRVAAYVQHRPGYPDEVVSFLQGLGLLPAGAIIADIGSGTGISSALFLKHGYAVTGIEPNAAMRAAAEISLIQSNLPRFTSVAGSAEATTLPDASVDFAVAGQAFHWFNRAAAKREFRRIVRPGGGAALFWNTRQLTGSSFAEAYEALLCHFGTDYARVRHDRISREVVGDFFSPALVEAAHIPSSQSFDFAGLAGRLMSSSYAPGPEHPAHQEMLADLQSLFDRCQKDGIVVMEYVTEVFAARFT